MSAPLVAEPGRPRWLDVSPLPHHAFGSRDLLWWGTLGFMAIEGTVFAVTLGAYLFLRGREMDWPPGAVAPPDLLWGTLTTLLMLASLVPNHLMKKAAEATHRRRTLLWLTVNDLIAVGFVLLRAQEFAHLNVRWDSNAYGSITWILLGFHTTHLITELVETVVVTVLVVHHADERRFVDVVEDSDYWYFVVLAWLPVYAAIYWLPRWT